jgi:hypothetical protein
MAAPAASTQTTISAVVGVLIVHPSGGLLRAGRHILRESGAWRLPAIQDPDGLLVVSPFAHSPDGLL